MIAATIAAVILIFVVNDLSLADTFSKIYPLPENYNTLDPKALSGAVFPVKLILSVIFTTLAWVMGMYLTRPESKDTLRSFYRLTRPGGPGWRRIIKEAVAEGDHIDEKDRGHAWEMPIQILCVFIGCIVIYSYLFSIGSFVYQNVTWGIILAVIATAGIVFLFKSFSRLRAD